MSGLLVKPLEFRECRSWGNSTKLIATDCFGNEFARLDLKGQPDAEISEFKAAAQSRYERRILSALASDASPRGEASEIDIRHEAYLQGWRTALAAHPSAATVEMREALNWAMDEIDTLSNKLCQFAYPQGMAMLNRAEQLPNYEAAVRERAALAPATPATSAETGASVGVKVKALEWHAVERARSDEDPRTEATGDHTATTPFGCYYIEMYFGSDSYGWEASFNGIPIADKDDPEAAKAAAQQDYETRILSALASATDAEGRA